MDNQWRQKASIPKNPSEGHNILNSRRGVRQRVLKSADDVPKGKSVQFHLAELNKICNCFTASGEKRFGAQWMGHPGQTADMPLVGTVKAQEKFTKWNSKGL